LLLSKIDRNIIADLKQERFDSDFHQAWDQLLEDLSKIPQDANKVELTASSSTGEVLTEPEADPIRRPQTRREQQKPGFLFLPYFLLSPPLPKEKEQKIFTEGQHLVLYEHGQLDPCSDPQSQDTTMCTESSLARDAVSTQNAALSMQTLAAMPLISAKGEAGKYLSALPVQSYIVFSSGVIRVFTHDEPHPSKFFGNQFPPTTFFPSRPYFWPTFIDHPSFYTELKSQPSSLDDLTHKQLSEVLTRAKGELATDATVGDFFRVSAPYLDLGGSGIVVTLTRGVIIDGVTRAVICIDLRFDDNNSVLAALRATIGRINADIFQVDCSVAQGSQQLICPNEKSFTTKEDELFHSVHNEFTRKSTDILGTLYRFDEGTNIRLSLPLNRVINRDGSQSVTLMLASFDPTIYRRRTSYFAMAAAASLALLVSFLAYLWGSIELSSDWYETAFKGVDQVMEQCPMPYARLDQNDKVIGSNQRFRSLFGIKPESEQPTLRSLCYDEQSRIEYDKVEGSRRIGENVNPYSLTLRTTANEPYTAVVHSAAVPSSSGSNQPDTFGVLLQE
jgi:hypothetical protein